MQSLRDQLLKAGLVSQEQVARLDEKAGKKRRRGRRSKTKTGPSAPEPRGVDVTDPDRLAVQQAIELHRYRGNREGDHPFHFPLRDGRVRKWLVNSEVASELESGKLAIVESGDAEHHALVASEAVPAIRAADSDAVRFHNAS